MGGGLCAGEWHKDKGGVRTYRSEPGTFQLPKGKPHVAELHFHVIISLIHLLQQMPDNYRVDTYNSFQNVKAPCGLGKFLMMSFFQLFTAGFRHFRIVKMYSRFLTLNAFWKVKAPYGIGYFPRFQFFQVLQLVKSRSEHLRFDVFPTLFAIGINIISFSTAATDINFEHFPACKHCPNRSVSGPAWPRYNPHKWWIKRKKMCFGLFTQTHLTRV